MKTRLLLGDGEERALTWTNRHPNQASKAGLVLFRHSSEVLDGPFARRIIAMGGRIETTHPERVRGALGFSGDEPGVFFMEREMDTRKIVLKGGSRDGETVEARINSGKVQPVIYMTRRISMDEIAALGIDEAVAWKSPEDVYDLVGEAYIFRETVHYKPA
jgi:hypothetical protein